MPDSEIFLRIFSSSWMSRLWTYQEGCLARVLDIQFADGIYSTSARHGYKKLKAQFEHDITSECTIKKVAVTHWHQLQLTKSTELSGPQRLMSCAASVRFRSTSQAADEPVCLATVLDCRFGDYKVDRNPESAMKWFWSQSEMKYSIFSRLLFLNLATMESEGYRWAPRTLMSSSRADVTEHWQISNNTEVERATVQNDGLHARFSAFAFDEAWTRSLPSLFVIYTANGQQFTVAVRGSRSDGKSLQGDCARHRKIAVVPPQVSDAIKLWILLYPSDLEALRFADNELVSKKISRGQPSIQQALLVYCTITNSEGIPIVYKIGVADV